MWHYFDSIFSLGSIPRHRLWSCMRVLNLKKKKKKKRSELHLRLDMILQLIGILAISTILHCTYLWGRCRRLIASMCTNRTVLLVVHPFTANICATLPTAGLQWWLNRKLILQSTLAITGCNFLLHQNLLAIPDSHTNAGPDSLAELNWICRPYWTLRVMTVWQRSAGFLSPLSPYNFLLLYRMA